MVKTSSLINSSGQKEEVNIEIPFMGFYNSVHNMRIDEAVESGFNYDYDTGEEKEITEEVADAIFSADVDWDAIRLEYAKNYVEAFGYEFDLSLRFDDLYSPKFYNYGTDRVFAWVPIEQINKIRKEVEADKSYPEYIKERYSDRSGFSSNYSSDYKDEDWTREKLDECQYRAILEFWIEYRNGMDWNDNESYMSESFEMQTWSSIQNAHEAIDKYLEEKKNV